MEGLNICKILGLLTITTTIFSGGETMTLTAESRNVRENENIVLHCEFETFVSGTYVEWIRYDQDGKEYKFGTNIEIEDQWKADLPNFSLQADLNIFDFQLIISNAQVEHSGVYACRAVAGADDNTEERIEIQVLQSPTELHFYIDNVELDSDDSEELEEEKKMRVKCDAIGGNPAPEIALFASDKDVTPRGSQSKEIEFSAGDVNGFDKRSGRTTLEYDLHVNTDFSHKQLHCKAFTEGLEDDVLTSPKYLITFAGTPPTMTCTELRIARPADTNILINCTVDANPAIHEAYVEFHRKDNASDIIRLVNGESHGRTMHFSETVDLHDPFRSYLMLKIDRVFEQMFRNYTFKASNSISSAEMTIELQKDPDYVDPSSSVAVLSVSIATVLTSVLAKMLL